MGQKLNPTIFRLGVNKTWKTEYFEKKNHELPLYVFKDLEIKDYIERILEVNGIILHDYKQHYNDSTLNLYISYFVTPDITLGQNKAIEKLIIKTTAGERKVIQKSAGKRDSLAAFHKKKMLEQSYRIKQYLKVDFYGQLTTNPALINLRPFLEIKNNKYLKKSVMLSKTKATGILAQIFRVLNLFLGKKLDIAANFCCVNKNVQFLRLTQKKTFFSFQKFRNTLFLKEGIELLFNVVYNSNSANLLAKFVAYQLKKVKRHKFFLSFLKQTLSVLLTSSLSKVKGIKIMVKGRLNGVPRAKQKVIVMGDVPVQTISAKLDYAQTTAHNSNGSYGIKVWVVEK